MYIALIGLWEQMESMRVKKSIYDFDYKKDDKNVVFNTFSKCCVRLDDEFFSRILNPIEYEPGEDRNIDYLVQNGILVREDFDEKEYLKYFYNKTCFNPEYLVLTIAPTLGCNFDCPYCFEKKHNGMMSKEVQDGILQFVSGKVAKGAKVLEVSFYGGEPLLCFDVIRYLVSGINAIKGEKELRIKYGIITNGYLLTKEMVDFFEINKFSVQITIDGMEEMHNLRRYLVNGDGTWKKITENLKLFENRQIDVYVRMNIDQENGSDFVKLCDFIESFNNPRMIVYPSITEEINDTDTRNLYLSEEGYDAFVLDEHNRAAFRNREKEVPISNDVSKIPDKRCYHCTAELDNTCVIDEKGNVYKCWDEIGIQSSICFNICEPQKCDYQNVLKYVSCDFFQDEKCGNCNKLPICFGGCRFHKNHSHKVKCAYSDEALINYIETYILKAK